MSCIGGFRYFISSKGHLKGVGSSYCTQVPAVLQQYNDDQWRPISYFSKKLQSAEQRYSTFDRELLAILYLAVKHFRHFVEGRNFHIRTDHKPLTYALATRNDRHSPRQARHLDFISQFTTDIRHVKGIWTMPLFQGSMQMHFWMRLLPWWILQQRPLPNRPSSLNYYLRPHSTTPLNG